MKEYSQQEHHCLHADVCLHEFISQPHHQFCFPHQPAENRLGSQTFGFYASQKSRVAKPDGGVRLHRQRCQPVAPKLNQTTLTRLEFFISVSVEKATQWLLGNMVEVREWPPPLLKAQQTPYRSALSYQNVCQITRESRG